MNQFKINNKKGGEYKLNKTFHFINDSIKITFKVPEILVNLMADAEKADLINDGSYDNLADSIDIWAKNYYADGKLTHEQWNTIVRRYQQ